MCTLIETGRPKQCPRVSINGAPDVQKTSDTHPCHHTAYMRRALVCDGPKTESFERILVWEDAPHELTGIREAVAFKMFNADIHETN